MVDKKNPGSKPGSCSIAYRLRLLPRRMPRSRSATPAMSSGELLVSLSLTVPLTSCASNSGFDTAKILRGRLGTWAGEFWARKGLVVFQFSISVIFIVAVLAVHQQLLYVQTKDLGYESDNVIYFETNGNVAARPEAFLSELKKISGVVNASSMLGNLFGGDGRSLGGGKPGVHSWQGEEVVMQVFQVNYDLIETLGIEIVQGRSFSRDHGSDTLQYIYNEKAIEALGIEDPVGKILPGGIEIVGVAKDFHYYTLHQQIKPHCLMLEPDYAMNIFVKLRSGTETETIDAISRLYKSFNPGFEFGFTFMDQAYRSQYTAERRVASLSKLFAVLAIVISCLGLFGLAAFTAERRTKEIGIRKVLGSDISGIVLLLTKDFSKTILVAIAIALIGIGSGSRLSAILPIVWSQSCSATSSI